MPAEIIDKAAHLYEIYDHFVNRGSGVDRKYFFNANHLDSGSLITDNAGQTYQTLAYTPYGSQLIDIKHYSNIYNEPYRFGGKIKDEESGLNYFEARYYWDDGGFPISTDPHWYNYPHITSYNWCGQNPIMNVDKNGKDFRLVKTTNQDGSVHLTIQTTIHIFGNKASQSTADYMQNKFKEWGKTQSVDNNVTMSFDIFVQYHATMESAMTAANNNAGDNLLEFATNPTSQYQLYPSYSYEFGEKKGYTNQTHGVAIKGGREAKSRELPANFHEIGHFFGFGDRYHKGKSGFNITDNGFEGDIMGVGYPNNINLKHYYDLYNLGKIDLTNGSNVVIPYRDIKNLLETP